jgi:hypothetical protein
MAHSPSREQSVRQGRNRGELASLHFLKLPWNDENLLNFRFVPFGVNFTSDMALFFINNRREEMGVL